MQGKHCVTKGLFHNRLASCHCATSNIKKAEHGQLIEWMIHLDDGGNSKRDVEDIFDTHNFAETAFVTDHGDKNPSPL